MSSQEYITVKTQEYKNMLQNLKYWRDEAQRQLKLRESHLNLFKTGFELDHIKENGLELDSPLLWALLKWDYVACGRGGIFYMFNKEPDMNKPGLFYHIGFVLPIKINYTGDWKESLTKRPEGM